MSLSSEKLDSKSTQKQKKYVWCCEFEQKSSKGHNTRTETLKERFPIQRDFCMSATNAVALFSIAAGSHDE